MDPEPDRRDPHHSHRDSHDLAASHDAVPRKREHAAKYAKEQQGTANDRGVRVHLLVGTHAANRIAAQYVYSGPAPRSIARRSR